MKKENNNSTHPTTIRLPQNLERSRLPVLRPVRRASARVRRASRCNCRGCSSTAQQAAAPTTTRRASGIRRARLERAVVRLAPSNRAEALSFAFTAARRRARATNRNGKAQNKNRYVMTKIKQSKAKCLEKKKPKFNNPNT